MERSRFAMAYDWQQTARNSDPRIQNHSRFQPAHASHSGSSSRPHEQHEADMRRFKQRKAGSREFSAALRNQIKERQNHRCAVLGESDTPLEVHHIVPKSHGGQGTLDNGVAVSHDVHVFLDKMAQHRKIYYDEIMEMGKEYVIGYLNATPNIQNRVVYGGQPPPQQLDTITSFADSDLAMAAGD